LGRAIALLPRQVHEAAAQSSMASIAQVQSKAQLDAIRAVQNDKTLSHDAKMAKMQQIMQPSGFGYGPQGGTYNPWEGILSGQEFAARQQQMQQSAAAFPVEQRAREVSLAAQPANVYGDTNQGGGATTTATAPAPQTDNPNDPDPDWTYSTEGYQSGGLVRQPMKAPISRPMATPPVRPIGEHLFNPRYQPQQVVQPQQNPYQGPPPATFLRQRPQQNQYQNQPRPATFLNRR
jgi:hypothetical protein